jgi:hypothetical protein
MGPPPLIWHLAMKAAAIPEGLARAWWEAVERSRWSEVVAWRQALLLLEAFGDPTRSSVWTPQRCLQILDRLWQEKRLSQGERALLQEHVLRKVDARGAWK